MGYHQNYNKLIYNLIQWKDELSRIKNKKFEKLISVLKKYNYSREDDKIPTNKDIANEMDIPYLKLNTLIKKLYKELIDDFSYAPLKIKECHQLIYIHIPYEEQKPELRKKDRSHYLKYTLMLDLQLPIIPRIGEEIKFDFVEPFDIYNHGYVHNITHTFKGTEQEIFIEVHPFDNDYKRWQKLKERYDQELAWRRFNR